MKTSSKVSTDSKKVSTKTSLSSTTSKTDLTKVAETKIPSKSKKISEVKKSKDDHLDEIPQIEEPLVAKTSKKSVSKKSTKLEEDDIIVVEKTESKKKSKTNVSTNDETTNGSTSILKPGPSNLTKKKSTLNRLADMIAKSPISEALRSSLLFLNNYFIVKKIIKFL